ncbi:hypothetical protein QUW13_06090 [Enterococcus hirae]|nr:hypothetical protein [Enterococcus hirae]
MSKKRSRKEFKDYNLYHDRPFGLKWGTAYAMDELVKGIRANEQEALKDNPPLPQMSRSAVDQVLAESFLYHREVAIQLNLKDRYGRLLDNLNGFFTGEAYEDYFVIDDQQIFWEEVRHISCKAEQKWFVLEPAQPALLALRLEEVTAIRTVKDEYYQPFYDETAQLSLFPHTKMGS